MSKRLAVLAVGAIAAVLVMGGGPASAAPAPKTISLFEMDTSDTVAGSTDPNQEPKVGDAFISIGTYYKWAGHKKGSAFGHLQVVCTVLSLTATSGWGQCSATAFFPGGTIEVVGPLSFTAHTNRLPIVGGTGTYVGAQGYVATTPVGGSDSNTSADVFHITN